MAEEALMKYMLTLFMEERDWSDMDPEEVAASMAGWDGYTRALKDADAFVAGEGLSPSATATRTPAPASPK